MFVLIKFFLFFGSIFFSYNAFSQENNNEEWVNYLNEKGCQYAYIGTPSSTIRCPRGEISDYEYSFPSTAIETTKFWDLNLSDNELSNLNFLEYLNEVVNDMDYQNNQLIEVDGLSNLRIVGRSINLSNNPLLDISGLSNLIEVQSLYISNTGIRDVDGLSSLSRIKSNLYLNGNQINNIEGLGNLNFVAGNFNLSNNNIRSLSGLENLNYAGIIDLRGNYNLNDLSGLENLMQVDFILLDNRVYEELPKRGSLFCRNQIFKKLSLTGSGYLRPNYPITMSFIRSCLEE